jgi:hypothetical protein
MWCYLTSRGRLWIERVSMSQNERGDILGDAPCGESCVAIDETNDRTVIGLFLVGECRVRSSCHEGLGRLIRGHTLQVDWSTTNDCTNAPRKEEETKDCSGDLDASGAPGLGSQQCTRMK